MSAEQNRLVDFAIHFEDYTRCSLLDDPIHPSAATRIDELLGLRYRDAAYANNAHEIARVVKLVNWYIARERQWECEEDPFSPTGRTPAKPNLPSELRHAKLCAWIANTAASL
jgi:hypothetical protein